MVILTAAPLAGLSEEKGCPLRVIGEQQAAKYAEDLEEFMDACDLMVLPTPPDVLSLDALLQTVDLLKPLGSVPPLSLLETKLLLP